MARKAKNPGVGKGHGIRAERQCRCIDCGASFVALRSDALRCPLCRENRDRQQRQRPRPERNKGQREYICDDCNAPFMVFRVQQRCESCQRKHRNALEAARERRLRKPCPTCNEPMARKAGQCRPCANAAGKYNRPGLSNPNWRGGRTRHQGYIRVKNPDPNGKPRYIGEHILVWERANGPVPKGWLVHHLNGLKDDNRLENLVAMSRSRHHRNHHEPWEARIRDLENQIT